ncbi:MAG TPA: hypothetical protein PKM10_04850 [Halanaerobiales bacterium]|nr:hypothetical protein [Halanaerobiales bacterium]HPZ62262.1 hypothetical protein [Halanaerobiales bacterium]HQD03582.1 hypothetical protein [Halanaerobiales bacterium]
MRKYLLLLLIFIFVGQVSAIEAGGEYAILANLSWHDGTYKTEISDFLNIDLFLPQVGNNEIQYSFIVTDPLLDLLEDKDAAYYTRKLYLRRKFDDFSLTVGRQPVSWAFGSLLNPVDYTPGSLVADRESSGKYTDALELYLPLEWNSGLSLLASYPGGFSTDFNKMKTGVRGRFGVGAFDLTLNYVQEAFSIRNSFFPRERLALTLKGDLKGMGVYAAFGHYFDDVLDSSNSLLLGIDYSYNLNYYTKITLQLEYLGLGNRSLSPVLGPFIFMNGRGDRLDLLSASLTYPVDDFSSISLMSMLNLDGSRIFISPVYQNTLSANIDLNLSGQVFFGEEYNFTSLSTGLTYSF